MVSAVASRRPSAASLSAQLLAQDGEERARNARQHRDFRVLDGNGELINFVHSKPTETQ